MTNIPGSNTVILDADALIGLMNQTDAHHETCRDIALYLAAHNFETVEPYAIILEAATALARDKKINRPDLAAQLLYDHVHTQEYPNFSYSVEPVVADLYNSKTSKKNTPFDHYILALAKKNNIKYVFSFDTFYEKNGLILVEDLL